MDTRATSFRLQDEYLIAVRRFATGLRDRGQYPFDQSNDTNDLRAFIGYHTGVRHPEPQQPGTKAGWKQRRRRNKKRA